MERSRRRTSAEARSAVWSSKRHRIPAWPRGIVSLVWYARGDGRALAGSAGVHGEAPGVLVRRGATRYIDYATAWFALHRALAEPRESVYIQGAAGSVGTAALQVAAALGLRTIAVVSSDEKERVARDLGADEVVRADGAWLHRVRELTGGRGVEIVIDTVGDDRFTDSVRSLAIGGRLVVVGFAGGEVPTIKVNRLLLRT